MRESDLNPIETPSQNVEPPTPLSAARSLDVNKHRTDLESEKTHEKEAEPGHLNARQGT